MSVPVRADTVRTGAVVTGVLFDSTAGVPLAGGLVQLLPGGRRDLPVRTVTTDSAGRFRVEGLASGRWAIGWLHPALDLYELEPSPRVVSLAPVDSVRLTLGVPGPAALHDVLCPDRPADDSSAALVGVLRDAGSGEVLAGGTVSVSWWTLEVAQGLRRARRRVPVRTGAAGTFRVCGLPADASLAVRIEAGAAGDTTHASGEVELAIPRGAARFIELSAGRTATVAAVDPSAPAPRARSGARATRAAVQPAARVLRGGAALTGTVRDDQGHPVPNARVLLLGAGRETTTSATGAFVLDSVPGGSWTAEARAIGYTPTRTAVTLYDGRPTRTTLAFAARVQTLEQVVVLGRPSPTVAFLADFARRKRASIGRFYTQQDLRAQNVVLLTQFFNTVPGAHVVSGDEFLNPVIRFREGCLPMLVLDGMPIPEGVRELDWLVRPQDVLGMEVYTSTTTLPPQYAGLTKGSTCGAVVVWTRP